MSNPSENDDYDIDYWPLPKGAFDWPKPVALSSSGWNSWERHMKGAYPVRYFLYETLKDFIDDYLTANIRTFKWWILHRLHPKHRHHIVKTRLKPGYYDTDMLILEASFALLCDFADFNDKNPSRDWQYDEESSRALKEINELRDWFVNVRPKRNEIFDTVPKIDILWNEIDSDTPEAKAYREHVDKVIASEIAWEKEDTEMLVRLVKIRNYLI
jgi:hypothetical protein